MINSHGYNEAEDISDENSWIHGAGGGITNEEDWGLYI